MTEESMTPAIDKVMEADKSTPEDFLAAAQEAYDLLGQVLSETGSMYILLGSMLGGAITTGPSLRQPTEQKEEQSEPVAAEIDRLLRLDQEPEHVVEPVSDIDIRYDPSDEVETAARRWQADDIDVIVQGQPYTLSCIGRHQSVRLVLAAALKRHAGSGGMLRADSWEVRAAGGDRLSPNMFVSAADGPLYIDLRPGVGG
jgi:hypothetical protein